MEIKEAIEILKYHNKWRRCDEEIEMTNPKQLGIAIDVVIRYFEEMGNIKNG